MSFDNFVFVFINQSRPARNWPELFLGVSCANLPPVKYNVVKFCTTYHASNCTNGESVSDKNTTLYHAHSHSRPALKFCTDLGVVVLVTVAAVSEDHLSRVVTCLLVTLEKHRLCAKVKAFLRPWPCLTFSRPHQNIAIVTCKGRECQN